MYTVEVLIDEFTIMVFAKILQLYIKDFDISYSYMLTMFVSEIYFFDLQNFLLVCY